VTAAASPPPPAPREAPLLEQAERLRDAVLASKLSAPDPWTYTPKARGWTQRAQAIVEDVARSGDAPAARSALQALRTEIEADADYQEAHRRA
jgi:hypothetical protein